MKLFVVIVTYNGVSWIRDCLNSVRASSVQAEVVIVDNASIDTTCQILTEEYPDCKLIQSKQNLGFGKANNEGIQYALQCGAEAVFLLNQDAILHSDTLGILLDIQKRNPDFGILSPIHLRGDAEDLDYGFKNYLFRDTQQALLKHQLLRHPLQEVYPFEFVNAALWLVSRECLKKVGGFNPYFFHYGEDRDYVNRLHYHGLKLGVVPTAFARHNRKQEDSEFKKQQLMMTLTETQWLNPLSALSITERIKQIKKQLLSDLIHFRWNKISSTWKRWNYFRLKEQDMISIKNKVLTKNEFLFLKDV
jgi:GT2 family glycosyltransferase